MIRRDSDTDDPENDTDRGLDDPDHVLEMILMIPIIDRMILITALISIIARSSNRESSPNARRFGLGTP